LFGTLRSWFNNLSGPKKAATIVVAVATGIGAVVGAINGSLDLYEELTERSSAANPLKLIDVGFTTVKQDPALDIKLTNVGEDPVIIKRADVRVKKIWTLRPPYFFDEKKCGATALASSYNYEIALPTKGAPYTVSENLSQSVGPSKSDRFTITLGRTNPKESLQQDLVFLMTVSLIYGEDDKTLLSKDVLYADPNEYGAWAYRPSGPTEFCMSAEGDFDKVKVHNEETMAEIQRIEAPSNAYLNNLSEKIL
jgi:hypothetical protein